MKDQLRGCVRINASGKHLYRFINGLHDGRLHCFGQYCRNDVFYGEIYRRDLPAVRKLAEEHGIELKSAEYHTVSEFVLRYKKRIGIILGVLLVLTAALYFSNVVVSIDIQGNSTVSDEEILSALSELNINRGTPLRKINFHICENELRIMVNKISWAGIRHTGNRVVVEVTELTDKPAMTLDRIPCNLISSKDALITALTVHDGQLMHKIGDFVPAGTLLVSGVSDDGRGHTLLHHAMGEVTGIYEETVTFSESFSRKEYVPTGRTAKKRWLRLFSLNVPLFIGKEEFSGADRVTTESALNFFGRELPVGFVGEDIAETELVESVSSEEDTEKRLMEKVFLYEKNFIDGSKKIIDRKIEKNKIDSGITCTVTYKLEGNIAVQNEIFIK